MRAFFAFLIAGGLLGCASNKSTQSVAGTLNAQRESAPLGSDMPRPSVSTAPPVAASTAPASDWSVTSIKGKFLTIDSTSVRVYLSLTTERTGGKTISAEEFREHFLVNYVVYPDYNNRERLAYGNVPLTEQSVLRDGDRLMLQFDLKRPKEAPNGVLLTEITETGTGKKALNDLPIRFRNARLSDRYTLFDKNGRLPQLRHYASVNDTVVIRDVAGSQQPLFLTRYRHDFDPASSPMNTSPRPAPRSLSIDSTARILTNQPLRLRDEGLYFFQEDTTQANGLGLVVADKRFPRLTRPNELVKPVMYMSTGTEINELNSAQDAKKALDRYWLSLMSGNEDVARRAIRAYYSRVEDANRLFTTYKEGWKTDKGMIFIILGPPDRVQRSRDREVWVYNRRANVAEINFTFNRKPNQFVEDHYELVRYAEYQPIWYPTVEAWRTGAIRE